jgi:hypothetical protein
MIGVIYLSLINYNGIFKAERFGIRKSFLMPNLGCENYPLLFSLILGLKK